MAIITNDTQFIGIAPSIDLNGKKSALLNAQTEPVTMLDIVDTVSAGLPPATNPTDQYVPFNYGGEFADSPLGVLDPPNGYFGWAGIRTQVGTLISTPPGVDQTNVAPYLEQYGLSITNTQVTGAKTVIGDYANLTGGYPMRLNIETPNSSAPRMYVDSAANNGQWDVFDLNSFGSKIRLGQAYTFNSNNLSNGVLADSSIGIFMANCNTTSPNSGVFKADGTTGIIRIGSGDYFGIGVDINNTAILFGDAFLSAPAPVDPVTPVTWVSVINSNGITFRLPLYQ